MSAPAATERFSARVDAYVRSRPGYPPELVDLLTRECGLTGDGAIADFGSGTGLLTRLFLNRGHRVFGVEPNAEMRAAGETLLRGYPNFVSVAAAAETSGLDAASLDLVVAGQAFHWFDRAAARREFVRVLRPGGWLALVWNERRTQATPFLRDFEQLLLEYGTDYANVRHDNIAAGDLAAFFAPQPMREARFDNLQGFDYEGLESRLLSMSYVPAAGQARHAEMLVALRACFARHARAGRVEFEYDTRMYYGRLTAPIA
jgi:SAM-dependent methyltransferase